MKKLLLALFLAVFAVAADNPLRAQSLDFTQRADGARVVPERFLREWDPITIFFAGDAGPKTGGPAEAHEKFATILDEPAGEWRWLGPRALQFRPAEAWAPLKRVTIRTGETERRLVSLLPTPVSTLPAAGADPVPELTQVALTFATPVDLAALSRLVSIEVRRAPGVAEGERLAQKDFDIAPIERGARNEQQNYVVRLRNPIGEGKVAILRLKLADEPGFEDEIFELRAATSPPFAVLDASCGRGWNDEKLDAALRCASNGGNANGDSAFSAASARRITLRFSAEPQALSILEAREALRIAPPVDDLSLEPDGNSLRIAAKFLSDRVYEISLAPGALRDSQGRPLARAFSQRFAFSRDTPALQWDAGYGLVERFGPQILPLRGRGYEHADIRIHPIDPLSRDFWPFPSQGVATLDADAPPLPGNEPQRWAEPADIQANAIKDRIKALGSPAVSRLAPLPLRRAGADARFGLDLSEDFARIKGREQPGAYLVGLRAPGEAARRWLRVIVTDLSLSAIEEPAGVRFVVTSLAMARPVSGAEIRIEGVKDDKFVTLAQGVTDEFGYFAWPLAKRGEAELRRVVVQKGLDTLVVDPESAPAEYAKENWTKPEAAWLSWTTDPQLPRVEAPRTLCHLFSERPIYRPEEPVHIKGYVRSYSGGALTPAKAAGALVINAPGGQEWRIPVKPDALGNFYHKFDAETQATGDYSVKYEPAAAKPKEAEKKADAGNSAQTPEEGQDQTAAAPAPIEDASCGAFTFKKEAYRLPTFEVVLNAPQMTPLDGEFSVDLIARYFAGGLAADRPVKWRAAQFPYVFQPPGREGFLFSTDQRFSGESKFKSTAVLERDQRTDAGGAARMSFDTTIEPTAQPRRYSIEATVTGDDGVEVRNVANVIAVPPFVLGVKTPRYVERPGTIAPELIAIDGKGQAVENLPMTLRLIKRNWISTLQASDFAQGAAKYVTQIEDETILERKVASAKEAQKIELEIKNAGVYLVQLEAYDRIGRRQQVSVDFFVGGDTPVTFRRAPSAMATVTSDKEKYAPGETATLLVQSPFQKARALAIVEQPDGRYDYQFFDIANGFGRFTLTLKKEQTPKLAVHFLIMRGRLKDSGENASASFDQGKPITIAATKWIEVTPVKNIVAVKLDAPQKARPGQEVEVTLTLADDQGKPLAGEATFWMVDQAVLSLAKEQPLDPLTNFIVPRETKMAARDTRNMAFGVIPLEEIPGGDGGLDEWGAETNISVRKNFTPVPIYLPSVKVGPEGSVKIKVKLPDTLTVFKLRAKAVSGADRFGFAGGEMLIRQELVAQPLLPRFVRPGDTLDLGLVARVVEGAGGGGSASIVAKGLELAGATTQKLDWPQGKPARVALRASVPKPKAGVETVKLGFRIERDADHAKDAVEVDLPIKPDRIPTQRFEVVEIGPGETKTLSPIDEPIRPASFSRRIVFAGDPAVAKLVAGLNALVQYPYGCTEQRVSLARAALALKAFSPLLSAAGFEGRVSSATKATAQAIDQAIDNDGLVAFWPRAQGNVSLTAWAYAFLSEAAKAGEPVDKTLTERLANALKNALRSDFPRLLRGEELRERATALAALGEGGKLDDAYLAEFTRQADFLPASAIAELASAATAQGSSADQRIVASLIDTLWTRVKFMQRGGQKVYGGQAEDNGNPIILPNEARALALMTRATALGAPTDPRSGLLRDALLRLGEGDGWGETDADSAAIRALAESWRRPSAPIVLTLTPGQAAPQKLTIDANAPAQNFTTGENAPLTVSNGANAPVVALVETRFEAAEPGAKAKADSRGFALTRALWRVKSDGAAAERAEPDANGVIKVKAGEAIEEVAELVNPQDRTHVAISLPLAAGFEPLNPNLATAPREAQPSAPLTLAPSWTSYGDDRVFYAYDSLPKGNYRFVFRVRAQTKGSFTQPSGVAETMYKKGILGTSAGARVEIGE
ncbi:MG2 domain-containing protein [Methylocystis bryophila]|uniref:Alpha-2-macroglobulin n=1 Tax=Methylocystis bryophila TaxID=655015 RepID=A0A1W6N187_9HYPH|nr:MG2 domain-containing protein [Methylocystis bryophila]ARN83567.1 alpha-2-macroglobulin [Methylocystis bryophila]BDV37471.1 hypothetical protein DSM21852_07240 [Methylocystis bryophila]